MSVLTINNLSQKFGDFNVFSGLNASIPQQARIGLVGPNGIGKTSLLLILNGLVLPFSGTVNRASNVQIGYLRQEAIDAFAQKENTVYDEMLTVFAWLKDIEAQLRDLETQMSNGGSDDILDTYGELQETFERRGGYDYEVRIKQTLDGLGFTPQHHATPLSHLSGGQKTRALLARLLLEQPDLLVLDEPTNHLDVRAVEWLENALNQWDGALLIASHDRYFLDKVVNTIWEMNRTGIESFRGNYSAYVRQRTERLDHHVKLYEQEKERLEKELDYVKRNIVRASTNPMAVGRLKRLSRDLIGIQQLGLVAYKSSKSWSETGIEGARPMGVAEAEKAIKALEPPVTRPPKLRVRLEPTLRSGDLVLRSQGLKIGYPTRTLFTADDVRLERGECAALIGDNGTGKTTLIKTLMGELPALAGTLKLGASVKVAYFAQVHDDLTAENTVLDEIIRHKEMLISEARSYLAPYLFRKDDVYKKVEMLSGGERGRLALAILGLGGANFLLLDEPTNHLDIPAQEALQEVLEGFNGTVLLVSHDRYLIDRLGTQIWNLENGHLRVFGGTYAEYLVARDAERLASKAQRAAAKQQIQAEQKQVQQSRPSTKATRQQAASVRALETEINTLESKLAELGKTLERPQSPAEVQRLGQDYAETQARLESLLEQWSQLAETNRASTV